MNKKIILIFVFFFFIFDCHAFDWKNCRRGGLSTNRGGWASTVVTGVTNHVISTGQYISSTGECAMLGKIDHEKKMYIAINYEKMKSDFAKGSGEFAFSFAELHGCNSILQKHFVRSVKRNYRELNHYEVASEDLYQYLEKYFVEDQILKKSCFI